MRNARDYQYQITFLSVLSYTNKQPPTKMGSKINEIG